VDWEPKAPWQQQQLLELGSEEAYRRQEMERWREMEVRAEERRSRLAQAAREEALRKEDALRTLEALEQVEDWRDLEAYEIKRRKEALRLLDELARVEARRAQAPSGPRSVLYSPWVRLRVGSAGWQRGSKSTKSTSWMLYDHRYPIWSLQEVGSNTLGTLMLYYLCRLGAWYMGLKLTDQECLDLIRPLSGPNSPAQALGSAVVSAVRAVFRATCWLCNLFC
jgi:hypothetical protein